MKDKSFITFRVPLSVKRRLQDKARAKNRSLSNFLYDELLKLLAA